MEGFGLNLEDAKASMASPIEQRTVLRSVRLAYAVYAC